MKNRLRNTIRDRDSEQGFAMPVAIGFGLVILLAAGVLITRSQNDNVAASAQKLTDSSLNVAEGGLARLQTFVNNNRAIATYSLSDWLSAPTSITGLTACSPVKPSDIANFAAASTSWQPLESGKPEKGEFKLLNYTYTPNDASKPNSTPGTATLEVAGRLVDKSSVSSLKVNIPVQPGDVIGIPIPGIWVTQGGINNPNGSGNTIQGNVLMNDCTASPNATQVTGTDPTTGEPYSAKYTSLILPDLPVKPNPIPNSLPGTMTGDVTLPRVGDVASSKTINGQTVSVYEYSVGTLDLAQNANLVITPGARVTLYLDGDIKKGGNIQHNCAGVATCNPTDLQIFGYGPSGSSICLNGNGYIEAFILAPNYAVGVAGSGGGQGGIKGAVWAASWNTGGGCGSNTSNIVAVQTANWDVLGLAPKNLPPKIAPLSSWQKQEVK